MLAITVRMCLWRWLGLNYCEINLSVGGRNLLMFVNKWVIRCACHIVICSDVFAVCLASAVCLPNQGSAMLCDGVRQRRRALLSFVA